ncbi:Arv1-like family-domain-containing protein [Papiliotrema laurentii]|uniref:Protein ARV n=1 Tax=Papiliotrema laurentii TaxID=5418 RepID=A0AAD9FLF5_PAPLA|nr:Arv1-like family-domain-containing protein [Papiliotrema laurentii]
MPICVHCAYPAKHLYTTYKTKSNIRLGVCPRCDRFLDPLIEHDPLILLLDLILLKPRVFLHLLFNRGTDPLDATAPPSPSAEEMSKDRRKTRIQEDVMILFGMVVLAETVSRVIPLDSSTFSSCLKIMCAVVCETAAQHTVTLGCALLVLRWRGWYPPRGSLQGVTDGRRVDFIPWLIPLTLLYTSLLPLLLQLFLSIWHSPPDPAFTPPAWDTFVDSLPFDISQHPYIRQIAMELADVWSKADRLWLGTRLLGGMSAGFGLRVLLPTRPCETTAIVLAGWAAAAFAARAMEGVLGA